MASAEYFSGGTSNTGSLLFLQVAYVTGSENTTLIVLLQKICFRRRTEGLRMRYCLHFV